MENCCFWSKNKHQRHFLSIFFILIIFFPNLNLNQQLNKNKNEQTKLFNFVVFATIQQNIGNKQSEFERKTQKSNQRSEEEIVKKISELDIEVEDNEILKDITFSNARKIKRRQTNNLKEKRRKVAKIEWEKEIIKEIKNSEKSEEENKIQNFVTVWRLFNLCSNSFVKIQKVGKRNKIEAKNVKGNNEDKCSTYFLPESVGSEDWSGKGQFILKHFTSGKFICFGRKEGLHVRTNFPSNKENFCHFHERLSTAGHSFFDSTYFNNRSIGFSLLGNPITKRKRRKNKNSEKCFLFTKLIIKLNKNEDFCNNINIIRRRRAEEGDKQKQLRETALRAVLARIEASEEKIEEENI